MAIEPEPRFMGIPEDDRLKAAQISASETLTQVQAAELLLYSQALLYAPHKTDAHPTTQIDRYPNRNPKHSQPNIDLIIIINQNLTEPEIEPTDNTPEVDPNPSEAKSH